MGTPEVSVRQSVVAILLGLAGGSLLFWKSRLERYRFILAGSASPAWILISLGGAPIHHQSVEDVRMS